MNELNKQNTPISQGEQSCYAYAGCRESAKAVIMDNVNRLRKRADQLQILHDSLPTKLTPEQDDALWSIACNLRVI